MTHTQRILKILAMIACAIPSLTNASLQTDLQNYNIYFINGVWNTNPADAAYSADLTDFKLGLPNGKVRPLYNSSTGFLRDLLETYQLSSLDGNDKTLNFWSWFFADFSNAPQQFKDITYDKLWVYSSLPSSDALNDLAQMKEKIQNAQITNKKTIIISHSEGNFFSNKVVDQIISEDQDIGKNCTGILAVGTPATRVANNGPWVTNSNDFIINGARLALPNGSEILPSNANVSINTYDFSGHQYKRTYLDAGPTSAKIFEGMQTLVSSINDSCSAPPVTPCGGSVSAGGGSENHTSKDIKLGTEPGQVEFEYEAYYIPDSFEVKTKAGNVILKKTGQISGFHTFKFDPSKYFSSSDTNRIVKVNVEGNSDPNTAWTYTMGCPGDNITNSDRQENLIGTIFKFSGDGATCNFDILVDGVSHHVGGFGGSFSVSLSQGTHAYKYANWSCSTQGLFPAYNAAYQDLSGTYAIKSPLYTTTFNNGGLFVVH